MSPKLYSAIRALARRRWCIAHTHAHVVALLAFATITTSDAHAQSHTATSSLSFSTVSTSDTLHLGDVYAELRANNPQAMAARALARAADARVPGASRLPDPQLQLGIMNRMLPGLAPMAALGMTQLQLMQMFPIGGKLAVAGDVARAEASVVDARAQDIFWEQQYKSALTFYDLYANDQALGVARETLQLLNDVAKTAESMYQVGDGRQTDVLRATVAIAKMVEDTLSMRATRESQVAQLGALLDRRTGVVFGTPLLPTFPDALPTQAWLDSVANVQRPTVRAELNTVRASEAAERLARKAIIPDVTVGVQYGQRGGDMGSTERMGSLMVGVSLPVFAHSRQYKMRDEAGAMRQMAEADLAAVRAKTRGDIGTAYAALVRARRLAALYRTTVLPQAEATVASAMAAYRVGNVDFMTLLDSRMLVNTYRQELYQLHADEGKAWAELEMLTGMSLVSSPATETHNSASSTARNNE